MIDISNLSPLAKADGVALLTRRSITTIYAMADGGDLVAGRLQWVFNVATNPAGKIRDLRFWMGELLAPEHQSALTLDQVIDFIVPATRREWPAGAVRNLLQVRHNTLLELCEELHGTLKTGGNFYPRQALVEFLRRRWLGVLADGHRQS